MEQVEVILGVDTHLDVHVGAVISETGKLLGTLSASANSSGYLDLLIWAKSLGNLRRAGVEAPEHMARDWHAFYSITKSKFGKCTAQTAQSGAFEASPAQLTRKAQHVQFYLARQRQSRKKSLELLKPCVPSLSRVAVPLRQKHRPSIS